MYPFTLVTDSTIDETASYFSQNAIKCVPLAFTIDNRTIEEKLEDALAAAGNSRVVVPTVFTSAPGVIRAFRQTEYAPRLEKTGVILSYICPLMYMNNPLSKKMPVITSSNKLRTYSSARYYSDAEILDKITKEENHHA